MARPILLARDELYRRAHDLASACYIEQHGLDQDDIRSGAGVLGLCEVQFYPRRRFDFRDRGTVAAVVEVLDADDETVVDLAAWPVFRPDRPDKVATMFGHAAVLGSARIRNPATFFGGRPLRAFRTPLAWLKAGCEGVVVLDEVKAVADLAGALGPIAGESIGHARELARALRPYVSPRRILAPTEREAA